MAHIKPECHLWGKTFSPFKLSELNQKLELRIANEPGEFVTIGKYKNRSTPYGACSNTTPEDIENSNRINWMEDLIAQNLNLLRETGATEINYWLYWMGLQANMEFSPNQIKKISDLGIYFCIDYIQENVNSI
jgi:hypothetical protein